MSAGRTGKPSGAARSTSKRHPPVASGQPDFRSARNRAYRERPSGEPGVRAPAMLEALAPRPRGGTVDTADLKSASGKPECRFESGRGHHTRLFRSTSVSPPSAPSAARLGQRDHATPELLTIAGVDVVFAHEREPAIPCDAIDHDPGG